MRYVTGDPITVRDLETLARTGTNLDGMRRWGYLTIDGTAKKVHNRRPGPGAVLRATAAACGRARSGGRWPASSSSAGGSASARTRSAALREPLTSMVSQLDPGLPDCLPILGPALFSRGPGLPPAAALARQQPTSPSAAAVGPAVPGPAGFAVEYEAEAGLALAVGANVLRVLGADGTRLRDLPALTGISQEAVSWALAS